MFRAAMCPSSGETTVFMQHLVLLILCGSLSGMQGGFQSTLHTRHHLYLIGFLTGISPLPFVSYSVFKTVFFRAMFNNSSCTEYRLIALSTPLTPTCFRCSREIAKGDYHLRDVRLSFCPHGATRPPLYGFSQNFKFDYISNICRENSRLVEIWRE
jgi:hypothetical protein